MLTTSVSPSFAWQAAPDPLIAPFPDTLPLRLLPVDSALGPAGSLGFTFEGVLERQRIGGHVAAAGDVNGDGIDDIVVQSLGSTSMGTRNEPETYVIFGVRGDQHEILPSGDIDGSNGFRINHVLRGFSIGATGIGDFNGDGHDDLLVGWPATSPEGRAGAGSATIVFGPGVTDGRATLTQADLDTGSAQWIHGGLPGEDLGYRVFPAGDVNGDGLADVLVSARVVPISGASRIELAYLIYGRRADAGGQWPPIDLASIEPDEGALLYHRYGGLSEFTGVGDINNDGYDDIGVSETQASPGGRLLGGVIFIVYGGPSLPTNIDATRLTPPRGMRFEGAFRQNLGQATAVGDLDGDGINDMAFGGWQGARQPGDPLLRSAFVAFGAPTDRPWPAVVLMSDPPASGLDGILTITSDQPDLQISSALAGPSDLNGDGRPDLAVGVSRFPRELAGGSRWRRSGVTMVVYGRDDAAGAAGFGETLILEDIRGAVGTRLYGRGIGNSGGSLSPAGDFNGDGRPDLVVGDVSHPVHDMDSAGEVQVVFGRKPCRVNLDGDGTLTIFDFLAFQNLFDIMDPLADFDGDGEFTIFDFLAFQNEFSAGC